EAVRHDFEAWQPKLSNCAVVLMHDTNERRENFGVWRLWAELRQQVPSFEFQHGHGLGGLATWTNVPGGLPGVFAPRNPPDTATLRERFALLGERWSVEQEAAYRAIETMKCEAARIAEKDAQIARLTTEVSSLDGQVRPLQQQVQSLQESLAALDIQR